MDRARSDRESAGPWPAPAPHERRPGPLSRELAAPEPLWPPKPPRTGPPLERVPLPEATIVRLPGGAIVPVTPLVARSARVPDTDEPDDEDPDDHGDDDPLTWDALDGEPTGNGAAAGAGAPGRDADVQAAGAGGGEPTVAGTAAAGAHDQGDAEADADAPSRWIGDARVPASVHVLRDRVVPGVRRPVDHLLVAPDGVWVVAVEAGRRVEIRKGDHRGFGDWRLLVGGNDHTELATEIGLAAHAVRKLAARDDVAVHAAVCVPGSDRTLARGPKRVHGVWVATPRQLVELVARPGPLRPGELAVVVDVLSARLRLAG